MLGRQVGRAQHDAARDAVELEQRERGGELGGWAQHHGGAAQPLPPRPAWCRRRAPRAGPAVSSDRKRRSSRPAAAARSHSDGGPATGMATARPGPPAARRRDATGHAWIAAAS